MPALLLDLDGTLVDSRHDIAAAGNAARRALEMSEQSVEQIAGYVGNGLGKLLERLFPDSSTEILQQARDAFDVFYADHCCDQTFLFPGISDVLHTVHQAGWSLHLQTSRH